MKSFTAGLGGCLGILAALVIVFVVVPAVLIAIGGGAQ